MKDGNHDLLETLLLQRHSCRAFKPDAVPHELIEKMLALAQRSASWCNAQPWRVMVTEGAATEHFRTALYGHALSQSTAGAQAFDPDVPFPVRYNGVLDTRRKQVGAQLYAAVGIAKGDRAGAATQALENFRFFGAPHVMMIHIDRDMGTYGFLDCGLYLGTLLLVAESLGIAMIPQAALACYPAFIANHFGLSDDLVCVAGVSFGYPDPKHPANAFRSTRADPPEVRFEHYR